VFMDNSNLFIEGKFTVGRLEQAGEFDFQRRIYQLHELCIDHGRLLSVVLKGRKMGSNPVIVGSRPPPNDSLWDRIKNQGFDAKIYQRNIENKEKKVDMFLGVSAAVTASTTDPGILVLVAGDGDYEPAISEAIKFNWTIEVWFWSSGMKYCFV